MLIAIHHRPGSFSDRWITYCEQQKLKYKLVNCYDSNIINQLKDCSVLLWHHHHTIFKDVIVAKSLMFALEHSGIKVFPNFKTSWHFDNKVAQKYLLESIDAPLVPSYVFYEKKDALSWANDTTFPKVFKLKSGSGSSNVKLVKSKSYCKKLIIKAFSGGFNQFNGRQNFIDHFKKYNEGKKNLTQLINSFARLFFSTNYSKNSPKEKGYVYFQDYIENDGFDVRVVVISSKAVALKRLVRENDFRASGSGKLIFENENIDIRYINLAFEIADKLESQSLAIDFIKDLQNKIFVVEISYGFPMVNFLDGASGYWDKNLTFKKEKFNLQAWILESLLT